MRLRKSPRLADFSYQGSFVYNLTFVTRKRQPFFRSADVVQTCLDALTMACERYGIGTIAFCFMPDHLHLLLAGRDGSSLGHFARHFKQLSGYHFKRTHGAGLWQISYYDHVVRREEDVQQIAAYIWDNPLRAGLVENRLDYSYSGPRELMGQT